MQPQSERRALRCLRNRRDHPSPAGRTMNGKAPMLRHHRRHVRQIDLLGHADDIGGKIPVQSAPAACAAVRTIINDCVGILDQDPAVAFVPGLGTAPGLA